MAHLLVDGGVRNVPLILNRPADARTNVQQTFGGKCTVTEVAVCYRIKSKGRALRYFSFRLEK